MIHKIRTPFIILKRQNFSAQDFLWVLPVIFHLCFVSIRPWAVVWIGEVYSPFKSWTAANQNFAWNFFVQFLFVSMVGGDCFNPMGHLSRWETGTQRIPKVIIALVGPLIFAVLVSNLLSSELKNGIVKALPHAKFCDTKHCVDQTCSCAMKLCGVTDALMGKCSTGRAQGCCIAMEHFILDEARHGFIFALIMRTLIPYTAPTLLVPLSASVFQMGTRMLPSTMTGGMFNPTPSLARAFLTGDFSVAPLAIVATLLGASCSNAFYMFMTAVTGTHMDDKLCRLGSLLASTFGAVAGHMLSNADPWFTAAGSLLGGAIGWSYLHKPTHGPAKPGVDSAKGPNLDSKGSKADAGKKDEGKPAAAAAATTSVVKKPIDTGAGAGAASQRKKKK